MKNIFFILTICSFLVGCVSAERQALMKDKYPYYPENIKQAIDRNLIVEGMNQEQVYLALGRTYCKSNQDYKGRNTEVWSYEPDSWTGRPMGTWDCSQATQHVYFENGIVIGWDNMQKANIVP